MNLQPIYPAEPAFRFNCATCGETWPSTAEGARADLDAAPGTYHCPVCAILKSGLSLASQAQALANLQDRPNPHRFRGLGL